MVGGVDCFLLQGGDAAGVVAATVSFGFTWGVLDPLQKELKVDVGKVHINTRSAPVSERGGGVPGFC
jgi:hypothetical protein